MWLIRSKVRYADMNRVRAMHSGAKTLLAHFHYVCKGNFPFRQDFDWTLATNQRMAELDPEQLRFVQGLVDELGRICTYVSERL